MFMKYLNSNMFLINILLLLFSNSSSLSVLYLLMFCILLFLMFKSVVSSLLLLIILVIFVTGVLLMLFYLSLVNVNMPNWSESNILWLLLLSPSFYYLNNLKFSIISTSLELYSPNLNKILFLMMSLIILSLLMINYFMLHFKYLRQLF